MSEHIVEYDCICESCGATGLYCGFAERDGAAVVCRECNGTGKKHVKFRYRDFEGKKPRKDIKRVFQANPGITVGAGETKTHETLILEDFGGMPYEDWLAGKRFPEKSEMRRFTCPAEWYQSVDYKRKPDWKECICCGVFSGCKNFVNRSACWARWDAEQEGKKKHG